jgi:hypothetical protein
MSSESARTLADLIDLRRGSTYKSSLLGHDGPVLLGLSSIAPNGGFRRDSLKTYGGESPTEMTLAPGDIYVSLKDVTQSADLLGAVARVPSDIAAGRLTQDTVRLIFKEGTSGEADYVYWLLRTPQYREYCRVHAIGVTTLALPRSDFLAFPAPPRTAERANIVDVLRALDDKIEAEVAFRKDLDEAIRLVGRHLTRDGSTTWPPEQLRVHFETTRGLSYSGAGLTDEPGLPLHNLNSVLEGGAYKFSGIKYYAGEFKERHTVVPGDLVVANTEQGFSELLIGYPAIIPSVFGERGIFSHHLHRVKLRKGSPLSQYWL